VLSLYVTNPLSSRQIRLSESSHSLPPCELLNLLKYDSGIETISGHHFSTTRRDTLTSQATWHESLHGRAEDPETAKPFPLKDVSLACSIGNPYDFAVYRVVQGFFPGGIRSKK
jgi:hypothetical protein